MKIFEERLKGLRLEKELSLKDMADILGIAKNSYYQYELGISEPKQEMMVRIAEYFGVSMDYLYGKAEI